MWKRKQMLSAAMTSVVLMGSGTAAAQAACTAEPVMPAEGLVWPAQGSVTREWNLDCSTDRGHRGIDIGLPAGSLVRASASGTVSFIGYTPAEGGGMSVSITHASGLRSTYLHLANTDVAVGSAVNQGDPIGTSDGAPLHFGIKTPSPHETYYDPQPYLTPLATSPAIAADPPAPDTAAAVIPAVAAADPIEPGTRSEPVAEQPQTETFRSGAPAESLPAGATETVSPDSRHAGDPDRIVFNDQPDDPVFRYQTDSQMMSRLAADGLISWPSVMSNQYGMGRQTLSGSPVFKTSDNENAAGAASRGDRQVDNIQAYRASSVRGTTMPLAIAALLTLLMVRGKKAGRKAGAQLAFVKRLKLA